MPNDRAVPNPPFRFRGVTSPNTTQVPDQYLDELLAILSGGELKVLLYITRRTFGFKKSSDNISLSQMLNGIRIRDGRVLDGGVGLTKKTLLQAIRSLEEKRIILTQRRRSAERGDEPTAYCLNIVGSSSVQKKEIDPVGEKLHQGGGGEITPGPWGKNSPTQQTVEQHTDFEYSNDEKDVDKSAADSSEKQLSFVQPDPAKARKGMESLAAEMHRRVMPKRSGDDRTSIEHAIERLAIELGDKAKPKASITRAMNLFVASGLHRDVFIDALHQAKGEVIDRRQNPGKAPLPANPMAYFFAVVEDRLGMRKE